MGLRFGLGLGLELVDHRVDARPERGARAAARGQRNSAVERGAHLGVELGVMVSTFMVSRVIVSTPWRGAQCHSKQGHSEHTLAWSSVAICCATALAASGSTPKLKKTWLGLGFGFGL